MEAKKSKKANLENKKTIFIQIGLIISLAFVLYAFEYKSYDKFEFIVGNGNIENIIDEMTQITVQKVEAQKIIALKSVTVINIVPDATEDLDDIDIKAEADQNTIIEDYLPPIEEDIFEEKKEIFEPVEEQPSFPGGEQARIIFLGKNLKYPRMAKERNIQGTVHLIFVVEPDGSISNIEIKRGIGGSCDEEALRVTKLMPNWLPGKQRGKAVRAQFYMRIKFTLQHQ